MELKAHLQLLVAKQRSFQRVKSRSCTDNIARKQNWDGTESSSSTPRGKTEEAFRECGNQEAVPTIVQDNKLNTIQYKLYLFCGSSKLNQKNPTFCLARIPQHSSPLRQSQLKCQQKWRRW